MLISFAGLGRRGEVRHCLTKRQLENCRETHKWEFNELVMSPLVIGEEKFLDNCYNHVGGGKVLSTVILHPYQILMICNTFMNNLKNTVVQ